MSEYAIVVGAKMKRQMSDGSWVEVGKEEQIQSVVLGAGDSVTITYTVVFTASPLHDEEHSRALLAEFKDDDLTFESAAEAALAILEGRAHGQTQP